MTDQFDVQLRDRLARVAAAVPVEPPSLLGSVASVPVRAGPTTRRLALGGLVPILAVALVGTLLAGLAKVGPFAPAASDAPVASEFSGPVLATTRSGDFELTIRAAKGRYEPGEATEIEASLAYLGQGAAVIRHAQGARVPGRGSVEGPDTGGTGGPIGFGIVEPVLGDLNLGPNWAQSCERTTLEPGEELAVPFEKGGAWSSDDPRTDEYRAFVQDPVLRLAEGTWHVYAIAEFSIGECGAAQIKMRVDIAIEVSAVPQPSEPVVNRTIATDTDGAFALTIRSAKAVYGADEPIDVTASLAFAGPAATVEISHGLGVNGGPLGFGIIEPVDVPGLGLIKLGGGYRLACVGSTMRRAAPIAAPYSKGGSPVLDPPDGPSLEELQAYMSDPVLRLPAGTWHVYAIAEFSTGSCDGRPYELRVEIAIVVSDDPAATPGPRPTPTLFDPGLQPIGDDQQVGPWQLTLTTPHRRVKAGETIEVTAGLGYWGEEDSVDTFGSNGGRVGFGVRNTDVEGFEMFPAMDADCRGHGSLAGNEPVEIPFQKSGGYGVGDPNAEFWEAWLEDPVLRLPTGRWEIFAMTYFTLSPDCRAPGPDLTARIVITVTQ